MQAALKHRQAPGSGVYNPGHGAPAPRPLRPGPPNGWRRGRVLRTLWPPAAGTRRWLRAHGMELVCVRHRADPLGLRRVVTVELVVAPIRSRLTGQALSPTAHYPFRVAPGDHTTRLRVRAAGGRQNPRTGIWHATGEVIEALGLLDWMIESKVR